MKKGTIPPKRRPRKGLHDFFLPGCARTVFKKSSQEFASRVDIFTVCDIISQEITHSWRISGSWNPGS
jgi:hypothetical protein